VLKPGEMAGQIEEGLSGTTKVKRAGKFILHWWKCGSVPVCQCASVPVCQCASVPVWRRPEIRRECGESGVTEGERVFVKDRKDRENFTAVDRCQVLQAGRPLRKEFESTNGR
jgi:hypothetical protein